MLRAKILLIDNNYEYREVLRRYFENSGYDVVLAASVSEARTALSRPDIDLALLDVRLEDDENPDDITGLLLAEEDCFVSVPKILLTAYPTAEHIRTFSRLPLALDYIAKSGEVELVLASVSKALSIVMVSKRQQTADRPDRLVTGREVFLVHGHDREAIHELARFLEKLALIPVILSETSDRGSKTIMELIEEWSKACFAIIIMTPDDACSSNEEPKRKTYRARQNVIFEMGYFIGKLGRGKVCVLRKGSVEMFSDVQGIFCIPMDLAGGWKLPLARQLTAAGFKIDLNTL